MLQVGEGSATPSAVPVPMPALGLRDEVALQELYFVIVVGTIVSRGQKHLAVDVVVTVV